MLVVLAAAGDAEAKKYTGKGYSFEYPDDWVEMTSEQVVEGARQKPALRGRAAKLDYSTVDVAVAKKKPGEFWPNINSAVIKGGTRATETEARKVGENMANAAQKVSRQSRLVEADVVTVGGHKAIRVVIESVELATGIPTSLMAYFIPVGDKTHVMTCMASREQFAEMKPVFETVVGSLKFTDTSSASDEIKDGVVDRMITGGILVGIVVAFAMPRILRKKRCPLEETMNP